MDFLPPVTLSLASSRSIQLPLTTPAASSSTDDYVNASHVQPLGTKKRYIATQGPLPETFDDFWLCVIMLLDILTVNLTCCC
jgi:tyrosine-protein phosphatase 2/3